MTQLESIKQSFEAVKDSLTVRRVYGDPIERDGILIIPAAAVAGGAGGGGGTDVAGNNGGGSGFGLKARPVGAFVVRDGDVRWEPVVDPVRQAELAVIATVLGLFMMRRMFRRRRRRR
jgi:uncharacterized spore protein YtfJ